LKVKSTRCVEELFLCGSQDRPDNHAWNEGMFNQTLFLNQSLTKWTGFLHMLLQKSFFCREIFIGLKKQSIEGQAVLFQ